MKFNPLSIHTLMEGIKVVLVFLTGLFLHQPCQGQGRKSETLEFPDYSIKIWDFVSEGGVSSSQEDRVTTDTLWISENPCEDDGYYISGKTLEVLPKHAGDSFAVFISFSATIPEVYEHVDFYRYRTTSVKLIRVSKNTFLLPEHINEEDYTGEMKQEFGFQDSSLVVPGEVTHYVRFVKAGKLYYISWDYAYCKICAYAGTKLKDVRYIAVGLSEGCD